MGYPGPHRSRGFGHVQVQALGRPASGVDVGKPGQAFWRCPTISLAEIELAAGFRQAKSLLRHCDVLALVARVSAEHKPAACVERAGSEDTYT